MTESQSSENSHLTTTEEGLHLNINLNGSVAIYI